MWCDACQDHFDTDHFDRPWTSPVDGQWYPDGAHGIGAEYGSYGVLLAWRRNAESVVALLKDAPVDDKGLTTVNRDGLVGVLEADTALRLNTSDDLY
jgi:hypothetical protein